MRSRDDLRINRKTDYSANHFGRDGGNKTNNEHNEEFYDTHCVSCEYFCLLPKNNS